ncbi:hypothetical protein Emin_0202 [Elusimicrobium minutum Pei191]|uniref:Type IV secretion system putative lipoprotein virB7 n=1 Tax=Elusimicrobium minutum (strain Pei191) TaxID=445932 RepID=B2KB06_ELUMP|nr:LPS assembly lipoprotein LptE [Elusimicrobium minutum]ACC97765.1 hypothetical protein Emin_0202 [Elusimicrobium minutum Pei191]
MKKVFLLISIAVILSACTDATYRPYQQIMPEHINKVAVRPFINKTQVFALEDKLTLRVTDEFLKNGYYQVVTENNSDGVVIGQITRYLMIPLQYDTQLIPTTYRMEIWLNVRFLDKKTDIVIWEEPALMSSYIYSAATLPGGMTEEQAREQIWDRLARDIVKRTTDGFGSVWSESRRSSQDNQEFTTITQ